MGTRILGMMQAMAVPTISGTEERTRWTTPAISPARRNLFADQSLANALAFATPMVALAMPGVSARMAEGVADFGGDLARFGADEMLASKREKLYDLPTSSEVGDAIGRQNPGGRDLEGRPLVARFVVGRTPDRVREQSINPQAFAAIAAEKTRDGLAAVPRGASLRNGDSGVLRLNRFTREPLGIDVYSGLKPDDSQRAAGHEVGHLLDEISGKIPTKGLSDELEALYHYGIEGVDRARNRTLPKHLGYKAEEAPREYMAEAIRQYMVAPGTMKARFPKTAARIREHVNANPRLMSLIQFNGKTRTCALMPRSPTLPAPNDRRPAPVIRHDAQRPVPPAFVPL